MSARQFPAASWPAIAAMSAGMAVVAGAVWLWADRGLVIMLDLASLAGAALGL